MRSNRTDRSPRSHRRGGFDDDFMMPASPYGERDSFNPSSRRPSSGAFASPAAEGPEVGAVVKWFNGEKGFGFVELADGTGDVFLHANSLNQAGFRAVDPGATLVVRVGQGPKGRQVVEVISVDESTSTPEQGRQAGGFGNKPPRSPNGFGGSTRPSQRSMPDLTHAEHVHGTVKWYNAVKGFGFITPDNGGKDIFVHVSALERSGIRDLNEGQTMNVQVVVGQKGPEAAAIDLT